jgi:hypothetical protein
MCSYDRQRADLRFDRSTNRYSRTNGRAAVRCQYEATTANGTELTKLRAKQIWKPSRCSLVRDGPCVRILTQPWILVAVPSMACYCLKANLLCDVGIFQTEGRK